MNGPRWNTGLACLTRVTAAGMKRSQTDEEMVRQGSLTNRSVHARHVEGAD